MKKLRTANIWRGRCQFEETKAQQKENNRNVVKSAKTLTLQNYYRNYYFFSHFIILLCVYSLPLCKIKFGGRKKNKGESVETYCRLMHDNHGIERAKEKIIRGHCENFISAHQGASIPTTILIINLIVNHIIFIM